MITASEALSRLKSGNDRFVANVRSAEAILSQVRRAELATAQTPFAIIVGCSDSRVPAEIVFDAGLGDLFVIRVAGNIVAPSQVGSVEFAADRFGVRLVVVLGHTSCGAIDATLQSLGQQSSPASRNVMSIVERIRPAVAPLAQTELARDPAALSQAAMRANVMASVSHLRHGSETLERLALESGLLVVGAQYDLTTGVVEFFDGVPPSTAG